MKRLFISCTAQLLAAIFTYESFASQSSNIDGKDQFLGASPLTQNGRTIDPSLLDVDEKEYKVMLEAGKAKRGGGIVKKFCMERGMEKKELSGKGREEKPDIIKDRYFQAKKSLINILNKEIYMFKWNLEEIDQFESWDSLRRGRRVPKISDDVSANRKRYEYINIFKKKFRDDKSFQGVEIFKALQRFLRESFLYWQVECGFQKVFDLKDFFDTTDANPTLASSLLAVPSEKLPFVRKIFLELFYGIKYIQFLSKEMILNGVKSCDMVTDFADNVEKLVHKAALDYNAQGAARNLVKSISKVEKHLLIADMSRRNEELKEKAKSVIRSHKGDESYSDRLAEMIRNKELEKLSEALNKEYNTCYMDNSITDLIYRTNHDLAEGQIKKKVEDICNSLEANQARKNVCEAYESLLTALLIDAQYILELGTICLGLDDFITLLKHLNNRKDKEWLSAGQGSKMRIVVDLIKMMLGYWEKYEECVKKTNATLSDESSRKLLLDKSGRRLICVDVNNGEYRTVLTTFENNLKEGLLPKDKCRTLQVAGSYPVEQAPLNNHSEKMILTDEDYEKIYEGFETQNPGVKREDNSSSSYRQLECESGDDSICSHIQSDVEEVFGTQSISSGGEGGHPDLSSDRSEEDQDSEEKNVGSMNSFVQQKGISKDGVARKRKYESQKGEKESKTRRLDTMPMMNVSQVGSK